MRLAPLEDPTEAPIVYLVERNGRQQEAIRDKLRKHGYRVLVAHNPQLAAQRFAAQRFDALIVDISRTEQEGLDTLRRIARVARERGEVCHCIVLLAWEQAYVARRIREDATLYDNVTLLFRPVRLLGLLATVKSLVPPRPRARASSPDRRQQELAGVWHSGEKG